MTLVVERVSIARGARRVIRELSLTVDAGEIVALVGPNGCGKSTLLASIAGVLPPRDGRITVADASVWGSTRQRQLARAHIGYVPEAADPPGFLRAEELWQLCLATRGSHVEPDGRAVIAGLSPAIVDGLGLDELRSLTLERMSLGQRRRACLGAALIAAPALLVLDEPDNGLDVKRLAALTSLLREHAGATILASHDASWLDALGARRVPLAPA